MSRSRKNKENKIEIKENKKPVSVIASRDKEMEVIPDKSVDIVDETKAGMKDIDPKKPAMEVFENPVLPIKEKKTKKQPKDTGTSLCKKTFNIHDGKNLRTYVKGVKYDLTEVPEEVKELLKKNEVFAIK